MEKSEGYRADTFWYENDPKEVYVLTPPPGVVVYNPTYTVKDTMLIDVLKVRLPCHGEFLIAQECGANKDLEWVVMHLRNYGGSTFKDCVKVVSSNYVDVMFKSVKAVKKGVKIDVPISEVTQAHLGLFSMSARVDCYPDHPEYKQELVDNFNAAVAALQGNAAFNVQFKL